MADRCTPTMEIRFRKTPKGKTMLEQKFVYLSGREEWRLVPSYTEDEVPIVEGIIEDQNQGERP